MLEQENYIPIIKGMPDILSTTLIQDIKNIPTSDVYLIQSDEPLEIIALKTMGSADYWWILGIYNDILNPFMVASQGKSVNIPDLHKLATLLTQNRIS